MLAAGCAKEQADVNVKDGKTAGIVVNVESATQRAEGNADFRVSEWNWSPSRVAMDGTGNLSWEAGDQIGIYEVAASGDTYSTPAETFTVASGEEGSASANFTGLAGFIKAGERYRAMYPASRIDAAAPAEWTIVDPQVQPVTNSSAHLKDYVLMASPLSSASGEDAATFTMQHLTSLLEFHITNSAATSPTLTKVFLNDNSGNKSFATKLSAGIDGEGNASTPIVYGDANANMKNIVTLNVSDAHPLTSDAAKLWMVVRTRDLITSTRAVTLAVETSEGTQKMLRQLPLIAAGDYGFIPGYRYQVDLNWADMAIPAGPGEYKLGWISTAGTAAKSRQQTFPDAPTVTAPEVTITSALQKTTNETGGATPSDAQWGGQMTPTVVPLGSDASMEELNNETTYVFTKYKSETNALTLKRIRFNIRRQDSDAGKGVAVFYKIGSGDFVNILKKTDLMAANSNAGNLIDIVLPTPVNIAAGEEVTIKFVQFWKTANSNACMWFFNSAWAVTATNTKGTGEALTIIGDVVPNP